MRTKKTDTHTFLARAGELHTAAATAVVAANNILVYTINRDKNIAARVRLETIYGMLWNFKIVPYLVYIYFEFVNFRYIA